MYILPTVYLYVLLFISKKQPPLPYKIKTVFFKTQMRSFYCVVRSLKFLKCYVFTERIIQRIGKFRGRGISRPQYGILFFSRRSLYIWFHITWLKHDSLCNIYFGNLILISGTVYRNTVLTKAYHFWMFGLCQWSHFYNKNARLRIAFPFRLTNQMFTLFFCLRRETIHFQKWFVLLF